MTMPSRTRHDSKTVEINTGTVALEGQLTVPEGAEGLVIFAHGSGSSRHSPRNRFVAGMLNDDGLATLLVDLLTSEEEVIDQQTRGMRFDIRLLAGRLVGVTDWATRNPPTGGLGIGYFGASTGAAAALFAAVERPDAVLAVVSRGGRPDLAEPVLEDVAAPTLLIVGGDDTPVITMNRQAYDLLGSEKHLEIVAGASHLFEEPGSLEKVGVLASQWFIRHVISRR